MVHLHHGSVLVRKSHRSFSHRYKNVVTGSMRADAPPLCLGGLLADVRSFSRHTLFALYLDKLTHVKDMGLGKTLTTLALIMSSIDTSSQLSQPSSAGVEFRPTLIVTSLSGNYGREKGQL